MNALKILFFISILFITESNLSQERCAKMPVEKGTIGSLFGYRIHSNSGIKKFHSGLGIRAKYGNSVYAAFDGKVMEVITSSRGYGNTIKILHGNGLVTLYAHLSTFSVKK